MEKKPVKKLEKDINSEKGIPVPFYKEHHFSGELNHIKNVIDRGETSGDGVYGLLCQEQLQAMYDYKEVLMTTSGTHALEMATMMLDLKAGDEVILPSFNFPSAGNAIVMTGAVPVFAEIDPATMNLDPGDLEKRITPRTKAIAVTHYAGVSCDMDRIIALADTYGLAIMEDAAQGAGAWYKGRPLGSMGDMGCLSFHGSKNFIAGEGGALVINKDVPERKRSLEMIRQKGTDRTSFMRGEVAKYQWIRWGSSYCPSELSMAMLYEQLLHEKEIHASRKEIVNIYLQGLQPLEESGFLQVMTIPDYCSPNYHIFYVILSGDLDRSQIQQALRQKGIETRFHFVPLHSAPMGAIYHPGSLPITEDLSRRLLRLPLYTGMSPAEGMAVVEGLNQVCKELGR